MILNNKVLVILGMHRSGTSLVANWFNASGLNVGDNLVGGNFSNVRGHFEDRDFLGLHQDLLEECGLHRWGLHSLKEVCLTREQIERVKGLIDDKNSRNREWGWKEPRTCLFLKYYRELLPEAKYFVVFRNAESVIESLVRRDLEEEIKSLNINGRMAGLRKRIARRVKYSEIYKHRKDEYLNAWKIYNSNILNHLEKVDKSNYLVFDYCNIMDNQDRIINYYNDLGFYGLHGVDYKSIYDCDLINERSRNVCCDNEINNLYNRLESFMDQSVEKI